MKILIADDDAVSRRLMERMLQHGGYEVITAANGRAAARELLCRNGPRLALMDWMMPELDGPISAANSATGLSSHMSTSRC
jgi:two-component system, cell cycle response regulator